LLLERHNADNLPSITGEKKSHHEVWTLWKFVDLAVEIHRQCFKGLNVYCPAICIIHGKSIYDDNLQFVFAFRCLYLLTNRFNVKRKVSSKYKLEPDTRSMPLSRPFS